MTTLPDTSLATGSRLPLLALLAANVISQIGNSLTHVAVIWFTLQTTSSTSMAGITALFMALPFTIAGVFGGAVVDRFGYKPVSVASDLLSGAAVAAIPLLHATVGLFWQLLALVFLGAVLDAPGEAARRSLIPDLAKLGGVRLERVNGANESAGRVALLLGPPLAGFLIAVLGSSNVLLVDAITFAASAGLVTLAVPGAIGGQDGELPAGRYVDDFVAGLRFIRGDRLVCSLMLTLGVAYAIGTALIAVVMPIYADKLFGSAADLGAAVAGFGGTLAGSLAYGAIGHRFPRRALFGGALLLAGIPFWILAATPPLAATIGALAFRGLAFGPVNPLVATLYQERTPIEMRGRVFGTVAAFGAATVAVGMALSGFLVEIIGLRATLLGMAVSYLAIGASIFLNPAFKSLEPESITKADM
jgi:MFS family permease